MSARVVHLLFALCLAAQLGRAQTTWLGTTSSVWADATNWSSGQVPDAATDVLIPAGPNSPSASTVHPQARDLTIESGATLTLSSNVDLTLNGDLWIQGALVVGSPGSAIRALGDWTNDGSFSNGGGRVTLEGVGSLGGSALTSFHDLTLAAGTRNLLRSLEVTGAVTQNANAALDVGAFEVLVAEGWSASVSNAPVTGSGALRFTGDGVLASGDNPLPNVIVESGTRSLQQSNVLGDYTQLGGQVTFVAGNVFAVAGDAQLLGGTIDFTSAQFFGGGVLDVEGALVGQNTCAPTSSGTIRCAGHWSSDAGFTPPTSLSVFLDGAGASTFGGTGIDLSLLTLQGGPKTLTDVLEVDQITVSAGVSLDLAADVRVQQSWTSSAAGASCTGLGSLIFEGANTTAVTGDNSVPRVVVTAGSFALGGAVRVDGELQLTGGLLTCTAGNLLAVAGDANLLAGTLDFTSAQFIGGGVLDLEGTATLTCVVAPSSSGTIRCAGDWSSSAAFVPSPNLGVRLDGGTSAQFGGAGVNASSLVIESGSKSLTSFLDVDILHVLAGASFELLDDVRITSSWDSSGVGATTTGSGTLIFDDPTNLLVTASNSVPRVEVRSGELLSGGHVNVDGELLQTGGRLTVQAGNIFQVAGDANLLAGELRFTSAQFVGGGVLDVLGDAVVTVANVPGSSGTFRCAGDWHTTSAYAPTANVTVELVGSQPATITGTDPLFANLVVVGGPRQLLVPASAERVTVQANSEFELQAALTVADSWASTATNALTTGSGVIVLDGADPTIATTPNSVPNLQLVSGTCLVGAGPIVEGNFTMTGGLLGIGGGNDMVIGQDADLLGGVLELYSAQFFGTGELIVAGGISADITWGPGSSAGVICCQGDWSSGPNFDPQNGTLKMDGPGTNTISGPALNFAKLQIAGGNKILLDPANVDEVTVDAGATFDLQADLFLNEDWTSTGVAANTVGTGSVVCVGDTTSVATAADTDIPHLRVVRGVFTTGGWTRVAGDFVMESGETVIAPTHILAVGGNCNLAAGAFTILVAQFAGGAALDVEGNFTCTAVYSASANGGTIRVGGNWSSSSTFVPTNTPVELDGFGDTLISGTIPSFDPTFDTLRILNGKRSVALDIELTADDAHIQPGATLEVSGQRLDVGPGTWEVDGTLAVGASGILGLSPTTVVQVDPGGTFRAVGSGPAGLATVTENGGRGYSLSILGQLAARNFAFEGMASTGVALGAGATIAALPDNFRRGSFDKCAAGAGARLLDLGLAGPHVFEELVFANSDGSANFNVRRSGAGTIGLLNFGGDFSGADFEDDATANLDWLPPIETVLESFEAKNGPEKVSVEWETSLEHTVDAFVLEVANAPGGPFAPLIEVPPAGPSTYAYEHAPLAPDQTLHYRLSQRLTDTTLEVLASDAAIPYSAALPANVFVVGPGGTHTSLQAAIDAASGPFTIVRLTAGSWEGASIQNPAGSLHVLGEPGAVIDASTTPLSVGQLGFGLVVELSDLVIDNASSAHAALEVQNCAGLVVLDESVVQSTGGAPGVRISASPTVAVQRSQLSGAPGLRAESGSTVYASRGSLDALELAGNSRARTCQLATSGNIEPGSDWIEFAGVMPDLAMQETQILGESFDVAIETEPGAFWQLLVSPSTLPIDLGDPALWQMLLMPNALDRIVVQSSQSDPVTGQASLALALPAEGAFLGLPLPFQLLTIQVLPSVSVRCGNLETVIGLP